ncbi:pentapeptide repeat-containing protein [Nodosilinea sp. LEGE 07088]|uniref:pentapeptide repeat-containing protein n=1 Tax=Nodosilinea sp. LEGE 07088 TaxID=2777968 RepID=UPI0018817F7A|nr:pentapeptide repeat-containing protein [Nodosilinea sp. LEGE 07088]MBE9140566.1 pentapeptide repeat-containing protein [Nodosilinea sp. LEGE 07088]
MTSAQRLKLPLVLGTTILMALSVSWKIQQNNVNEFQQKIFELEQNIDGLSGTLSQDQEISLQKDLTSLVKDKVTLQNGVYVSLIQLLGGAFFFVTAYFTWRNVKTAEANLKATEEKQITERFSKSIEHLGSEKLEVRLGGIYSLERIAKDSEKDYWQVIEVLTAFVREKYKLETKQKPFKYSKTEDELMDEYIESQRYEQEYDYDDYEEVRRRSPNEEYIHPVPVEVQAVLSAIGRCAKPQNLLATESIDLSRTELSGVFLTGDLRGINFEGSNLQWVKIKEANLSRSNFSDTNLEVAQIENSNLQDANLQGLTLQWSRLINVILKGSNLENANLTESLLQKVVIDNAILSGTNFRKSRLMEVSLKKSDFEDSYLSGVDLSYADLKDLNLQFFDLDDAILKGADLENAVLDEADLKNVDFEEAILVRVSFRGANLKAAIFKGANLQEADFTGARLLGTDFRSAVNLSPDKVKMAKHWRAAIYDPEMRKELGLEPEGNE